MTAKKTNALPHYSQSSQSVYAECLSNCRQRYGYPLLSPKPSSTLTGSYQKEGLKIGDVGYVTPDGIFYVHCNITCDPGATINRNHLPSDFKCIRLDDSDIEVDPDAIPSPYIVKSQHVTEEYTNNPRAPRVFRSSESSGAILILPCGARFENLKAPKSFYRIAEQHGYEWCMKAEENSVYLITGLYKARSWSRGCFDRPPGRIEATPEDGQFPFQKYIWTTERGTMYSAGHTEDSDHNQTIFMRGFWITKKDSSGQKDRSCSGLRSLVMNCLRRNKIVKVWHEPMFASPLDTDTLAKTNRRLLEKHPTADIAIIHDDEWTHILDELGLSCNGSTQVDHLVECLLEKSGIVVEHGRGVASLRKTISHPSPLNGRPFSTVPVIKTIRIDNVFSGLRRMPFGFYVHIDPPKWNTKTRFTTVDNPIIEWVEDIDIPLLSPTEKVKLSICVVFGSNPTLGGREVLHTVEIGAKDLAKAIYHEQAQFLAPAVFLTLTERPADRLRTGSFHESDRSRKTLSPTIADRTNLGNDALIRYYQDYKTEDIMESIQHFRCSLLAISREDHCYAAAVFNLATAQLNNYLLGGTYTDFNESVILPYQEILDILPVGHPDRPSTLLHLAQALLYRFGKHGYEEHSNLNIVTLMEEVEKTCSMNSHEHQVMSLILQTYQIYRLVRSGDLRDLDALLEELDMAIRVCPEGYFDKPHRLINLAIALHVYSRHHNDCINDSVTAHEEALRLIPPRHPDRVAFLISLSTVLLTRFRLRSDPDDLSDLNESIRIITEAEQLVPNGHVDRPTCLHTFGVALLQRFEQSSNLTDIHRSVSLIDETLGLIRSEHPDKASYSHSLCMALLRRFDVRTDFGDLSDINRSISLGDEALQLVLNEHPNKMTYLHLFSAALLRRFDICRDLSDLDRYIAVLEEILQLVPSAHSERVAYLDSLDAARRRRSNLCADSIDLNNEALDEPQRGLSSNNTPISATVSPSSPDSRLSLTLPNLTTPVTLGADNPLVHRAQQRLSPNVLIVGETGVGKSSVINLIAGENIAKVSTGAGGCTTKPTSYDIVFPDDRGLSHHIHLFDTVGLNELQFGRNQYLAAIEKVSTLIYQLQRTDGIRLLVFCIRAGRITAVMQTSYRLFCDILCQNQVPVAFVITGLENEPSMMGWWEKNVGLFEKYGLSCASHACITAIRGLNNCYAKKYAESQTTVRAMLLAHVTGDSTSWQPERTEWFTRLASRLYKWSSQIRNRRHVLTEQELTRHLRDKCKFSRADAMYLAGRILTKRREAWKNNFIESGDTWSIDAVYGDDGVN